MDVQDHLAGFRLAVQVVAKHRSLSEEEVEELSVQAGSGLHAEQVDADQPGLRWLPLLYFEMTEDPVQLGIEGGFAGIAMRGVGEQAVGGLLGGVELLEQGIEDGHLVFPVAVWVWLIPSWRRNPSVRQANSPGWRSRMAPRAQ